MTNILINVLYFGLIIPFTFVILTFISGIKNKAAHETIYKILAIMSFFTITLIIYYQGILLEGTYDTQLRLIFTVAISKTLQTMTANFDVDVMLIALSNQRFQTLFHLTSYSFAIFIFYSVIALISKKLIQSIQYKIYRFSHHMFIIGDFEIVNMFLSSLTQEHKFQRALFGWKKHKIILLSDSKANFQTLSRRYNQLYLCYKPISPNAIVIHDFISINIRHQMHFVSLYDDDIFNVSILNMVHSYLESNQERLVQLNQIFRFYIQLNQLDNLDLYTYSERNNQHISIYNYHTIVSFDRMMKNPIINYSNMQKHMVFIGFGLTNSNIYRNYLPDNVIDPTVKYTIVTHDDCNNLSHIYLHLNTDLSSHDDDYLEKPSFDSLRKHTTLLTLDLFENNDYNKLIRTIDPNDELIIYIAVGDDIKNIKITQQLLNTLKYQFDDFNYKIMTRVKNKNLDISKIFNNTSNHIETFGSLSDVYTYDNIIHEEYSILAKRIHETLYGTKWLDLSYYDRRASLFAIPSIRNKLRTLGFDLSTCGADASLAFCEAYGCSSQIEEWKPLTNTSGFDRYLISNKRNFLARYEHMRWSLYMILNGFNQMSISEFNKHLNDHDSTTNPAKNLIKKRHFCITTFEELIKVANMIDEHNQKNSLHRRIDYFYADYVVMDQLLQIIHHTKYKIIKY